MRPPSAWRPRSHGARRQFASLALERLHRLLRALAGSVLRATQLFALWLAVETLAGTQLSWILRPYLGKPTLPVQFLRDGALQGSFLEEVGRWLGL